MVFLCRSPGDLTPLGSRLWAMAVALTQRKMAIAPVETLGMEKPAGSIDEPAPAIESFYHCELGQKSRWGVTQALSRYRPNGYRLI